MKKHAGDSKPFLWVFLPFLITMGSHRMMGFMDFWMVSKLGSTETAAFVLPFNLTFIDQIIAFSLVPIVISQLSSFKNADLVAKYDHILTFVTSTSLITMGACFVIYPMLLLFLRLEQALLALVLPSILIKTVFIPVKMLQLATSISLHSLNAGRYAIWISLLLLTLNYPLNSLLMYDLELGFIGAILSTEILTFLHLTLNMYLMRKRFGCRVPMSLSLQPSHFKTLIPEAIRLFSERFYLILTLMVITYFSKQDPHLLTSYAVFTMIQSVIIIPSIALTRSSAIYLKKSQDKRHIPSLIHSVILLGSIVVSSALLISAYKDYGFAYVVPSYSTDMNHWLIPCLIIMVLLVPLTLYNSSMKGLYVAKNQLGKLAKFEMTTTWLLGAPSLLGGLLLSAPFVVWTSFFVSELAHTLALNRYRSA